MHEISQLGEDPITIEESSMGCMFIQQGKTLEIDQLYIRDLVEGIERIIVSMEEDAIFNMSGKSVKIHREPFSTRYILNIDDNETNEIYLDEEGMRECVARLPLMMI